MKRLIAISIVILLWSCKKEAGMAPAVADVAAPQRVAEPQSKPQPQRMIVRRADMRILVDDTSKAVAAVTKAIEASGGYVSDSNIWRDGELLRAKLTLRVPSDQLTAALASIRSVAKRVETETISSEDVSQEYVDLDSHVRNLEATEAELLELLKVARVNSRKATDILEVHEQISLIREQIEQTKGRMRYLSQVTAMSSITLEAVPDAIAKPVVEPGWQPLVVAKDASRALVGVMQSVANAAIWLVIYVVPIFGMLALVIAGLWKWSRRSRAREA